jgi:hypothetical protein
MFFANWRLLVRRWYVVVAGLVATAVLCAVAVHVVPIRYQATASVLLLPPNSSVAQEGGNPFLALGGLDVAAGVISRAMTDKATQQEVTKGGAPGTYTLEPDAVAGGPLLVITAEADSPQGALATLAVVNRILPTTLRTVQTGVGISPASLIRARPLTLDDAAQPVRKPQIRALLVALVAGLALTLLVASLIDGMLLRRSGGRRLSGTYHKVNGTDSGVPVHGVNGVNGSAPAGQRNPVASIDGPTTRLRARFDPITGKVTDRP